MWKIRRIKGYLDVLLFLVAIFALSGGYWIREKIYYSDKSNYITEEAVVEEMVYNEESENIKIFLSDIDERYQSSEFVVHGESVDILLERDVFEKIEPGNRITYTSAPEYFGDGYSMPIVSVSVNGEVLLSFDEGFENLMKLY